jgi:CubicO group peptidase (beta-lactamase class C family)
MKPTVRSAVTLRPMRPARATTTPMAARRGTEVTPPPRRVTGLLGIAIALGIVLGSGIAAALPTRPIDAVANVSAAPCAVAPIFPPPAAAVGRRLDAVLIRIDEATSVPGIGAAVFFPDGTAWTGARGYADVEQQRPVTSSTGFAFASAGKIAIAGLLLRAAEHHELSLSDSVLSLLPRSPISPRATVAQLLSHRAGLGDYLTAAATETTITAAPDALLRPDDLLAAAGDPRPPGVFDYSNTGYLFAAALLERGGESYLLRLRRELLDPFELCSISAPARESSPLLLARGYDARDGGWVPTAGDGLMGPGRAVLSAAGPAGGLAGTPLDLARLGAVVMGNGFLSTASRERAFPDAVGAYGLGFMRYSIAGRAVYGHNGRLGGTRTAVRFDPVSGIAVAVAWNRGDPDPDTAAALLLAAALR